MEKILVDARADACPLPVVKATKALQQVKTETEITVLVGNDIAVQNLQRLAAGKGLSAQVSPCEGGFAVKMTATADTTDAPAPVACPDCHSDVVVAVGSATMGDGDEKLGKILMKGFLYALSQQPVLPRAVLFYNGGAFLTTGDSESLEDLRSMEQQGVQIATCGTCLDFYGLKDKLKVGTVTNMYQIVETLATASSVVKP